MTASSTTSWCVVVLLKDGYSRKWCVYSMQIPRHSTTAAYAGRHIDIFYLIERWMMKAMNSVMNERRGQDDFSGRSQQEETKGSCVRLVNRDEWSSYPRKHVSLWTSNCRFRSFCSLGNGFLYVCRFFRDVFDRKVVVKREQVLKILRQTLLFSSSSWTTQVDDEEEENRKNSKLNAKVNGKITIKQKRVKRNSHTKSHRRRRRNSRLQNLGRHPFNKAIPRTNPLYFALLNPSLSLQLRVLIRFARQNWDSRELSFPRHGVWFLLIQAQSQSENLRAFRSLRHCTAVYEGWCKDAQLICCRCRSW